MERIENEIRSSVEAGKLQNACLAEADRMLSAVKTKEEAKKFVNFIFDKAGGRFNYFERVQGGIFMYMLIMFVKTCMSGEDLSMKYLKTLSEQEAKNAGPAEEGTIGKLMEGAEDNSANPVADLCIAWTVKDAAGRQRAASTAASVCASIISGEPFQVIEDEGYPIFDDDEDEDFEIPIDAILDE